jgi:Tfp pilus assembly protein PilO
MALSLDMDVGDIIDELFKKKKLKKSGAEVIADNAPAIEEAIGESSATRQARDVIIATTFVLLVSIVYVMYYYIPKHEEIAKQTEKLKELGEQRDGIASLDSQINNRQQQLEKSKILYTTILTYFDKSKELEDLYKSVSDLAIKNSLTVSNIKVITDAPKKIAPLEKNADGTPKPRPPEKKYKDNKVYIELDGKYGSYMKFKKLLLERKNLLTIHNESVSVITDKKQGTTKVTVKLNLSTYTIDKEPYQEALKDEPSA